jgi:NAD(P)-dependent dehydrogenase (short-subunit alcohol dehydrogenase family)
MNSFNSIWKKAKIWNRVPLGPVSLIFRMAKTTKISNNVIRKFKAKVKGGVVFAAQEVKDLQNANNTATKIETALIVGVGPGLGFALANKLCEFGFNLAVASRNAERLDPLVAGLRLKSNTIHSAYGCDATLEKSVLNLYDRVCEEIAVPDLVVYSLQSFNPGKTIDIEVCAFEESWRQNCLGAFIVAREAARRMLPRGSGTIVLVGSTSGLFGRESHLNLAVGKFGLRALSQVMARELWGSGIHVVHCVIDADIKENDLQPPSYPQANPEDLADFIYQLHRQPRTTWTSEADIRPFNEKFWEHC